MSKENKTEKQENNGEKIINLEVRQKSEFLGTERRKNAMRIILQLCRENLPMEYKKFICVLSYRTGLTIRKVEEDYIEVLKTVGVLQQNKYMLELGAEEKNV
jgi:hypothetical protein